MDNFARMFSIIWNLEVSLQFIFKSLIHDFLLNRNAMCVFFQVPKTRAFSLCLCYSVNSTKMYNKLPNKFLKCYFDSKCLLKHTKMFEQNQAYQIFPVSSVFCLSYQCSWFCVSPSRVMSTSGGWTILTSRARWWGRPRCTARSSEMDSKQNRIVQNLI